MAVAEAGQGDRVTIADVQAVVADLDGQRGASVA
jgi:hypothetical protein